jgi:hypothetical protein
VKDASRSAIIYVSHWSGLGWRDKSGGELTEGYFPVPIEATASTELIGLFGFWIAGILPPKMAGSLPSTEFGPLVVPPGAWAEALVRRERNPRTITEKPILNESGRWVLTGWCPKDESLTAYI